MFSRLLSLPKNKSFFLLGPRGTGKSSWTAQVLPNATLIDLLENNLHVTLAADPGRLAGMIPDRASWVIIDEVQRNPELLNEVHRLIERKRLHFALTGSSARKLRRQGVNLLAGRALSLSMHPLTAVELGKEFDLKHSLIHGQLPMSYVDDDPALYLKSYVGTYVREEVLQEGLTRNIGAFARFMEAAAFSQASVLNISTVARDCSVDRKVVEGYFEILEDLLIGVRIPVFKRRAKRRITSHPKFFYFDCGVYRAIRPRGPLDAADEIEGPALETLVLQDLRATIASLSLDYGIHFWRSATDAEVDFVLYGERGFKAIEVKRNAQVRAEDFRGLRDFLDDYPQAEGILLYGGQRRYKEGKVNVIPIEDFLKNLPELI